MTSLAAHRDRALHLFMGTVGYMSPEQVGAAAEAPS